MVIRPPRLRNNENMAILNICITLHNMIIENECEDDLGYDYDAHSVPARFV